MLVELKYTVCAKPLIRIWTIIFMNIKDENKCPSDMHGKARPIQTPVIRMKLKYNIKNILLYLCTHYNN